jgi:hypothetical protein
MGLLHYKNTGMNGFTTSWKIFRAICIVQLILVAFRGISAFSQLFYKGNKLINFIDTIAYALVFVFVYQGLSMLNYNYPDVPLSPKQKRTFNILYLINFILIAYLFAQVVNTWWLVLFILEAGNNGRFNIWLLIGPIALSWIIFIIHLIFLAGMYRLRRFIHQNTISSWYQQFEQKP